MKVAIFHAIVVPFGTSGMVQVDRPLVLVPLVPRRSEDPLLLVLLVPRTPTCPNLSHLVVPLVLSQLSFLRFFWVSYCHSIFRKTLSTEIFSSKYCHIGEGKQQPNFHKKTEDNRDHTLEHMGIFCLEFNSSAL